MTTTASVASEPDDYGRAVAAEIRSVAARRGMSQHELALKAERNDFWVSRRISAKSSRNVAITVDDLRAFADALEVPVSTLLPRLDSNQQPSGSGSTQVSDLSVKRDAAYARRKRAAQQPPKPTGPTLPEAS